jgi:hypothetical protein
MDCLSFRRVAKWIWEHVATLFGSERTEIVDWFHATEHIWTVAKELHGEGTSWTCVATSSADGHWSASLDFLQSPVRPRDAWQIG